MHRTFEGHPAMLQTYEQCKRSRPVPTDGETGAAFWQGYSEQSRLALFPVCGAWGSVARAAWLAGVDCRLADQAMMLDWRYVNGAWVFVDIRKPVTERDVEEYLF